MKTKFIILVSLLLITTIGICQSNLNNEFDEVYKKEIQEENRALSQRIEKLPAEIISINNEIKIALRNSDFSKAFDLGVEMDKKLPKNDDIKNFLGKMSVKLGNSNRAISYFDEALKINPSSKWLYINKIAVLSETGKNEEALQVVTDLIEKNPNWFISYNVKGSILLNSDKKEEALKAFSRALEIEPNSAQVLTNRGNLYLDRKEIQKAIADFEKALQVQPNYEPARIKLNYLVK